MNFPRSTIKKSLHIIPDSLKDGITGDAQVTIGYQVYNLAKLTHTTAGIANLQFGDYNINTVGLYGKNIEIHADTGRLNEYATDDIFIGSAGSMLRIGMYSGTTFDNGVNFMLMTPDVTKFQDKQVIIAVSNSYKNANEVLINSVKTNYGGCLLVGDYDKAHIALDNFQIQAKKNGVDAADLYLNPIGGDIILNANSSVIFNSISSNKLNLASIYFSASGTAYIPKFTNFKTGEEEDIINSLTIHSIGSAFIYANKFYIGCETSIDNSLSIYGNTELNGDTDGLSIKSDNWTNTIMNVKGSYENRNATVSIDADVVLNYRKTDNDSADLNNPRLRFIYNYNLNRSGYTDSLEIYAGSTSINSTKWRGLIIGSGNYRNSLATIFTDEVCIKEKTTIYGDTILGNINDLDNFKTLTVYGKSRFVGNGIELYYKTPYIDFHFGGDASSSSLSDNSSSDDNTSRIIESTKGVLEATPKFKSTFITNSYGGSTGAPSNPVEGQLYFEYI